VHGLISALPRAYETVLPQESHLLSPGQTQRIALARALYRRPRFLFLDEPNALLDPSGERFVFEALRRLKEEGTTIVMSMHRGGIIGLADRVLVLDRGKVADFGPRREVLERLDGAPRTLHVPVRAEAEEDVADWVASQFRRTEDGELRFKSMSIARHLFRFARDNGPLTASRQLTLHFRFLSETRCEITLSEPRRTQLRSKIEAVRLRLRDPARPPLDLAEDEVALAQVLQLSETVDFQTADRLSSLCARVSGPEQPQARPH
jgi:ABC-type multidrug transport system ATPase subunit